MVYLYRERRLFLRTKISLGTCDKDRSAVITERKSGFKNNYELSETLRVQMRLARLTDDKRTSAVEWRARAGALGSFSRRKNCVGS